MTNKHARLQALTTLFRPLLTLARSGHRSRRPTHCCGQLRKVSYELRVLTICLCPCLCALSCSYCQLRIDTKTNENLLGAFARLGSIVAFWHVNTRNGAERTVLTLVERAVSYTLAPVTTCTSCFVRLRMVTKEYGVLTTIEFTGDRTARGEGTLCISTLNAACYC